VDDTCNLFFSNSGSQLRGHSFKLLKSYQGQVLESVLSNKVTVTK